jgi:phosphoglycerate dehydrogenase-like enzyme
MSRPAQRQRPVVAILGADHARRPPGLEPVAELATLRFAASLPELSAALQDAQVLFVWDFRSTLLREAWPHARHLEWVHVAGAGVDAVVFPDLAQSDVVLTNSRGVFDQPIAEYVLGLMLAFAKDLPTTLDLQRRHVWQHRESERLAGQTLLVVGAGGIGRAIGRLARAVGLQVLAAARTPRSSDPDLGRVVAMTDLDTVLPQADYVVVAAPLTPETEGIFGAQAFARMKSTARFINVGRGPLVDEAALVDALRSRRIAGAALDVFVHEPLVPDHPLWNLPGLIVSPHMSGDFVGWLPALAKLFVDNFQRWWRGDPLLNVVDKQRGYVPTEDVPTETRAITVPGARR